MASTKAKTAKTEAAEAPAPKVEAVEPRLCACEQCGQVVGPKSLFRPGHDMKRKSALLKAFDAGEVEAGEELLARGWKSAEQLIERTNKAEAKAAAKAAKAEAAAAKAEKEVE